MNTGPFSKSKPKLESNINVVPYIDVMLVLLVIFMVTAPLLTTGVEVDLPQASAQALTPEEPPVIINVSAGNVLSYSQGDATTNAANLSELTDALTSMGDTKNMSVLINADGTNAYSDVVALMAALQSSGISKVGFLTEPAESP